MDDQFGLRMRTRPAIIAMSVLAGLLSPVAASAQTGTPPSARPAPGPTASQAATQPPSAAELGAWRTKLLEVPKPKKGCFTAAFPSTEWKEMPCTTPPARPYPPPASGFGPPNVVGGGGSNDVAAQVTGQISSANGSFDSTTSGVTTETGTTFAGPGCMNPTSGVANTFSLQLNSRPFTTSVCTSAGCQGWQQFVYSNSYGGFIQYWLLNVGASCPAGWTSFQNGAQLDCYQNDPNGAPVPSSTDIKNLTQLQLNGTASAAGDTVTVTVGGTAYASAPNSDGVLKLAQGWQAAEFNIFGDSCGSQAVFQGTPTINVRTNVNNGTTNAPTCVSQSYTGETNNLNFGPTAPAVTPGAVPAVLFEESSAGGASSACAAAVRVGDTHLATIAGTHYDFQASGNFLLAEVGPDFIVHTRQQSGAPTWPNATVNKAVSTRLGKTSVAVCAAPTRLIVDGRARNLVDGKSLSLPDGVRVLRNGAVYLIQRK